MPRYREEIKAKGIASFAPRPQMQQIEFRTDVVAGPKTALNRSVRVTIGAHSAGFLLMAMREVYGADSIRRALDQMEHSSMSIPEL